jgi:tetratricopeptide (TPR) repeat protein
MFGIPRPILFLAFAVMARADQPVGLVLNPGGSKLLRANTETPLAARPGDLLFAGDGLRTESAAASFLFCPAKALQTLSPSGEIHFDPKAPKVKSGQISEKPAGACVLPETLRVAVASQQHYGVSMTRGGTNDFPPIPRDKLPADVVGELPPDSKDPADLVASAVVFEKHKLLANTLDAYRKLLEQWPDAVWVKSKIFDLEQAIATQTAATAAAGPGGQTYALLIGISKYKRPDLSLQYADADATLFSELLKSQRGGAVPAENLTLLTDEKATLAAVRLAFQDLLKRRAQKTDTVIILIAGHGTVDGKNAFILTYDADPQDLASTALPMSEVAGLFQDQVKKVGRVLLFSDVCRAGTIGTIQSTTVNSDVQHLGDAEGDLFGLLASRTKELSLEGPQFGGGHGVFSYFVVKGLSGAADANGDGVVDANELIDYVSSQVPKASSGHQHPREFGAYDNSMRLSDIKKPGPDIARFPILFDSKRGRPLYLTSNAPSFADSEDMTRFNDAIAKGRLLPDQPSNAFDALKALKPQVMPDRYIEIENQLRIALENRAQDVLLRYLSGDQNPQTQQDFDQGARYMQAERTLTNESLFLEGREDFFAGRAMLFDKKFADAAGRIEQAVRIDPGAAYAYNALGIAYLEQAQFDKAIPAFRDAARRAPHWSYPLHNEALADIEIGEYQRAIRLYQQAMRLTPQYSYLPYNLGLVYQRLNRRADAQASYRLAIKLSPNAPEAYNALGTLKAGEGKSAEAEQLYRDALSRKADLQPARHNLALLLASEKNRQVEAIQLFRANLPYLPSELSLAELLASTGDKPGAIEQYRNILTQQPGYIAARLALAHLLEPAGALEQLRIVTQTDPDNVAALEQIGDLESAAGHATEARVAYAKAIAAASDHATKKRISGKLKTLTP